MGDADEDESVLTPTTNWPLQIPPRVIPPPQQQQQQQEQEQDFMNAFRGHQQFTPTAEQMDFIHGY